MSAHQHAVALMLMPPCAELSMSRPGPVAMSPCFSPNGGDPARVPRQQQLAFLLPEAGLQQLHGSYPLQSSGSLVNAEEALVTSAFPKSRRPEELAGRGALRTGIRGAASQDAAMLLGAGVLVGASCALVEVRLQRRQRGRRQQRSWEELWRPPGGSEQLESRACSSSSAVARRCVATDASTGGGGGTRDSKAARLWKVMRRLFSRRRKSTGTETKTSEAEAQRLAEGAAGGISVQTATSTCLASLNGKPCGLSASCPRRDYPPWVDTPVDYDYRKSTEENYGCQPFIGENAQIRALLDYSWHKMYKAERVWMQDQMVKEFFLPVMERGDKTRPPWVVFTAGAMGSGKGYVTRWMQQKGYMPRENFVVCDLDKIRQKLPEWETYSQKDPMLAGEMTQKEAGHIAEILGYKALRGHLNVVFDGSLRNAAWYMKYFTKLRWQFPSIRIMILHVVTDEKQVMINSEKRAQQTGRYVPKAKLINTMAIVPKSVRTLAPYADFVCRVQNIVGEDPRLEREPCSARPAEAVNLEWELFNHLWEDVPLKGDGTLSKLEVDCALSQGVISLADVDFCGGRNADGGLEKASLRDAKAKARGRVKKREAEATATGVR
eukprot:TRINITY_DN121677_c0_g1_i1.p1 TRINITY_DN121677_c0_g1~~TRINITY_DN121677_c0_g1_i1.p1  ORF type:complete len:607 (-),score=121.57 TRINITY_DN121677_c0_g1_i1:171-1991(-)